MHDGKNIRGVIQYDADPALTRCRTATFRRPACVTVAFLRLDRGRRDVRPAPVVGLRREREVLTVALATGRHVVIEGPPGTGKSTLLRSIARDTGQDVVFVEGNAELDPGPAGRPVRPVAGARRRATAPRASSTARCSPRCASGGLLYLEELNRVPEETLNVLITVLTEGEIAVPRLGTVRAGKDFRLIAAMNPFDAVGTARVSQAIADRMCRVVLGYQDEPAERAITAVGQRADGPARRRCRCALTRATREHRDVRMGSSVRGAIDLALRAHRARASCAASAEPGTGDGPGRRLRRAVGPDPVADGVDRTAGVGDRRAAGRALAATTEPRTRDAGARGRRGKS